MAAKKNDQSEKPQTGKPSALVDTRVVYCGDNLDQLAKLPDRCVDLLSFEAVMMREDRTKGFFIAFDFTSDALTEIDAFFRRSYKAIIPLTVKSILEGDLAQKLA